MTEKRVSDTRSRALKYQTRHYPDNFDFYMMQARAQVLHQDNPNYSIKFFQQKIDTNSLKKQMLIAMVSLLLIHMLEIISKQMIT